jgi:N-acyl homoserine lactone hydrolase
MEGLTGDVEMNTSAGLWDVVPFDAGSFMFPDDEEYAGQEGAVVAHVLRSPDGSIFLFDTGIGVGDPGLDARYRPTERPLDEALAALGHGIGDVVAATNCHLHADHAGQNHRLAGIPIYVQRAEWEAASRPGYTVARFVDGPDLTYEVIEGDQEVLPGIRILATPGHTAGHQSIVVATKRGAALLTGQAVYSRDEWVGRAGREGRSSAPDVNAYERSLRRLHGLAPTTVHFAHNRSTWEPRYATDASVT